MKKHLAIVLLIIIQSIVGYSQITEYKTLERDVLCSDTNTPRQREKNQVYTQGRTFIFSYQYVKDGKTFYCKPTSSRNWEFASADEENDSIAVKVKMTMPVSIAETLRKAISRHQKVIEYTLLNSKDNRPSQSAEYTGVIEDRKEIWLHPTRVYCI